MLALVMLPLEASADFMSGDQLSDTVCNYLAANPGVRQQHAADITKAALEASFPCEAN